MIYYNFLEYDKALTLYQQAIPLAGKTNYTTCMITIYNNISSVYTGWGKHDSAILYLQKSLEIAQKINVIEKISTAFNNIGYEYMVWKKYPLAMEFFNKALEIDNRINNDLFVVSDYNNIGLIYFYEGDPDKALEIFKKAKEISEKAGSNYYLSLSLGNIGKVLYSEKIYNEAREYTQRALDITEENTFTEFYARNYQQLGLIYQALGDYHNCLESLHKSREISEKNNRRDDMIKTYKLLSDVYKLVNMTDSALYYFELHSSLKDSVFNIEQHKQLAEFQAKYELIKKENELIDIKSENLHVIFQKKMLILLLIVSIVVLSFIIFIFYKKYLKHKQIINFISLQKKEIEIRLKDLSSNEKLNEEYSGWNLSVEATSEVYNKVHYFLTKSELFLNDKLTLNMLAQKTNIQVHHISKAVNSVTNSSFSDYINSLRINKAKNRLKDTDFNIFTIEAIGRSVGFKSRTSFIAAFKKIEGITPSEFKKKYENNLMIEVGIN